VVSSLGLDTEQLVQSKIRLMPIPSDKNLLLYFKFDKEWKDSDSFYFRQGIKGTNIAFESSNDIERVCYCTTLP
jgi:hypothetical protein